jgi:hypothetical protein
MCRLGDTKKLMIEVNPKPTLASRVAPNSRCGPTSIPFFLIGAQGPGGIPREVSCYGARIDAHIYAGNQVGVIRRKEGDVSLVTWPWQTLQRRSLTERIQPSE